MIEAHGLSRRYGGFVAVQDVSFAVNEGEIVGILGPNGAGKTTTIRMMTGFLPPTEGRVTVGGRDLFAEPRRARRDIGYLPENVALYPEMRVEEYLTYRARLVGLGRAEVRGAVGEAVERALVADVRRQIIGTLSKGYRQRVGLATAILHRPPVLVLDEPTIGLDPKQIIAIRELIRELGGERTLLLSTHILPEVELLCDRVVVFDRGRIVARGSLAELSGQPGLRVGLTGVAEGALAAVAERLAALPGVESVRALETAAADGGVARWRLDVASGADPRPDVFRAAVEAGWTLVELVEQRPSLEEVFVGLVTRDVAGEAAADDEPEAAPEAAAEPAAEDEQPGDAGEPEPGAEPDAELEPEEETR